MNDITPHYASGHFSEAAGRHLNPREAGAVIGSLLGGWHLLWAIVVAAGWGQQVLDFVLWLHFMKPSFVIDAFSPYRAVALIFITSAIGCGFGYVGALVWNWLRRS